MSETEKPQVDAADEAGTTPPTVQDAARPSRARKPPRNWREVFLARYAELGCSIAEAADLAGISTKTVKRERDRNPEFAENFEQARERAVSRGNREAWVRGAFGWDEPVFGTVLVTDTNGQVQKVTGQVGTIRRFDAKLLLAWLARHDPESWSLRQRFEHSGPGGGPISFEQTDEFRAEVEALLGQMAAKDSPVPQE